MASSDGTYIRSGLARTLYEKLKRDEVLKNIDKSEWYSVDLSGVQPWLVSRFVQLAADADTEAFLAKCHARADWLFTQMWHALAKTVLSLFMSQTSANGWLRRGSMFVCSRRQFLRLLAAPADWRAGSLLDIGAGDGAVTERLAPLFRHVFVTEVSPVMRSVLAAKQFTVLDVDDWQRGSLSGYDVITCLNVLDRCDRPLQLLRELAAQLAAGAFLLVTVVLPLRPYVEEGENSDHTPVEFLNIEGATFAEKVASFIDIAVRPAELEVVRWSRLPYLCEGDLRQAFYWLDDAVLLLRHNSNNSSSQQCSPN